MEKEKEIMKAWLRRVLCCHKFREVGYYMFGRVLHCRKCDSIYYDGLGLRKQYLGQYDDFADEKGVIRL